MEDPADGAEATFIVQFYLLMHIAPPCIDMQLQIYGQGHDIVTHLIHNPY